MEKLEENLITVSQAHLLCSKLIFFVLLILVVNKIDYTPFSEFKMIR